MKFRPRSEDEIASGNLLKPGEYDFEVVAGEDQISSAGNEMIKLTLRVFSPEGWHVKCYDYLLESVAYKLRHAAGACDLMTKYEGGNLSGSDFNGRSGRCNVRIEKQDGYRDKNSVSDYIVSKRNPQNIQAASARVIYDDIPF